MNNYRDKLIEYLYDFNVRADISIESLADDIVDDIEHLPAKTCNCYKSDGLDEYWGHWIICEDCGYSDNTIEAEYCGGCGKEIHITK